MTVSELPVLDVAGAAHSEQDLRIRLALYAEINQAWRALAEVRFKLLGAMPTASGLGLFGLLDGAKDQSTGRGAFALLGLIATIGLWIYDARNSDLYDDLVSRGRRLEHELGVTAATFKGRPKPSWPIQHGVALALVYGASVVAWATAAIILLAR